MTNYEIACYRALRYLSLWGRAFVWIIGILISVILTVTFEIHFLWSIAIAAIILVGLDLFFEKKADDYRNTLMQNQYEKEQQAE